VHGKQLVYLDNAATSQKPQIVIDAITDYYTKYNSNIHRGAHYLAEQATIAYEEARKKVAQFVGARSDKLINFTKGATEAINLVAHSFGNTFLEEGDEILLSAMAHHSNLVPWQIIAEQKRCSIKYIPVLEDGTLDMDAFHLLLNKKTKIVSVGYISNALYF